MRITTSPRQGCRREAGSEGSWRPACRQAGRTARRGTRTTEQAHFPRTSWHHTVKSGEPRDRVNAAPVQRPLTFFSGESCLVSWAGAGHLPAGRHGGHGLSARVSRADRRAAVRSGHPSSTPLGGPSAGPHREDKAEGGPPRRRQTRTG